MTHTNDNPPLRLKLQGGPYNVRAIRSLAPPADKRFAVGVLKFDGASRLVYGDTQADNVHLGGGPADFQRVEVSNKGAFKWAVIYDSASGNLTYEP